jgi:hypothetical protein
MRFWSEGLGRRELVMELGKAVVGTDEDAILLTGVVSKPAPWAYRVTMETRDWYAILRTATSPEACQFLTNSVKIRDIVAMGWWMAAFVVLLAVYRFRRLVPILARDRSSPAAQLPGQGADKGHVPTTVQSAEEARRSAAIARAAAARRMRSANKPENLGSRSG